MKLFGSRGKTYQYVYELTDPPAAKDLVYKTSDFTIAFQIDQGAVNYTLKNTSKSRLSVMGGSASIGINGRYYPTRSTATYYIDTAAIAMTATVLPGGSTEDFFIPRGNIYYNNGKWVEKVLFATRDYDNAAARQAIRKNVGSEVALYMPMRLGTTMQEYTFKFRISGVKTVSPDSIAVPNPRVPVPHISKHPLTSTEMWTTIGVISTLVLVSVYFLTRSQPFPGGL